MQGYESFVGSRLRFLDVLISSCRQTEPHYLASFCHHHGGSQLNRNHHGCSYVREAHNPNCPRVLPDSSCLRKTWENPRISRISHHPSSAPYLQQHRQSRFPKAHTCRRRTSRTARTHAPDRIRGKARHGSHALLRRPGRQ